MKIISARTGRVLLHVTDVRIVNYRGGPVPFYSYVGEGCGGCGPAESVAATVAAILADAPRARVTGELPTC